MDSTLFKEVLGVSTTVSTFLQFLSGSLVCRKFIAKGSSNDVSSLPFISGLLSCCLWLVYGKIINDWAVLCVNTVGTALMLVYAILYCYYTTKKAVFFKQALAVTLLITIVEVYSTVETDKQSMKNRVGIFACSISLLFFASPLTQLGRVLKNKSTECLPFPIILMAFIVTSQWILYGLVIQDMFIVYPNAAGCILSAVQLSLFILYPSQRKK